MRSALLWFISGCITLSCVACGGGGGGDAPAAAGIAADSNRFLKFLNPTANRYKESEESALAYYSAVDPNNSKDTLTKWQAANAFNLGFDAKAVYRNAVDLGFGRRMVVRRNNNGTVAAYVENYPTLAQAVNADRTGVPTGLLATVAMEFGPPPGGGAMYTKFFTFGPDGSRLTKIDLDGRGAKYQPGVCNICHGGAPSRTVRNGNVVSYPEAGDTRAQFIPWDLDTYEYSTEPGYTKAEQEIQFRALNRLVLGTYPPNPANAPAGRWSGAAAREAIEGWYGGPGLPNQTFNGNFAPTGWSGPPGPSAPPGGGLPLDTYKDVVAPTCRMCHMMRGTMYQSDVDFGTFDKFDTFRTDIYYHVLSNATMPAAKVTYERLWKDKIPGSEVRYGTPLTAAEVLHRNYFGYKDFFVSPGLRAIISDFLLTRFVNFPATVPLDARQSIFAESFEWSLVRRPAGSNAAISDRFASLASLTPDVQGDYEVLLTTRKGSQQASTSMVVRSQAGNANQHPSFAEIQQIISTSCTSACHNAAGGGVYPGIPYEFLGSYDRLRDYVNFDYLLSPLGSKPAGRHHRGGIISSGDPARRINLWIYGNAAPQ